MIFTGKRIILCMNNFFDPVLSNYGDKFKFIYPKEMHQFIDKVEGIITTPWTIVDSNTISLFPNLKIISCFGTGTDAVNKKFAIEKDVIVTNTPDVVTNDTADIAIALILSLSRQLVHNDRFTRSGKWKNNSPKLGSTLSEKSLGILGLGNVGKAIAKRAEPFHLNIFYSSRSMKNDVSYRYFSNLKEMAKIVDFLIVSCPATEETKNIINLDILKELGPKGYLINVSRGDTVNEDDLIFALKNNIIAGAGLDVYKNEPNVREDLLELSNTVLLPHIGTATQETRKKMLLLALDNIKSYFEYGKALSPVCV